MSGTQLGLRIAFYSYPVLLFITLLGVQSIQYYRERKREQKEGPKNARRTAPEDSEQKQRADRISRISATVIWILQFFLSVLFLASIIVTVREALRDQDAGTVTFPFSAYLVSIAAAQPRLLPLVVDDYWYSIC